MCDIHTNHFAIMPKDIQSRCKLLMEGVRRANPKAPSGALPFPGFILVAIVRAWGDSHIRWISMLATMAMLAFLAMLRGAKVVGVPSEDCAGCLELWRK